MRRFLQFLAGLIGIVILLAIVEYLPAPRPTHFWDATFDTGHILVFGIGVMMSLTMVRAFLGRYRKRWQYFVSCLLTLALGVCVEIWQSQHNRTAEWIDVYNDVVGILAFAAVYAIFDKRIEEPRVGLLRRVRLLWLACAIVAVGLIPFYGTVHLYHVRHSILPHLVDWEQPWYAIFYYEQSAIFELVDPPKTWPAEVLSPRRVAKITLTNKGKYPGFVFREPHADWSGYSAIEIDVLFSGRQPMRFEFRAHDIGHGIDYEDRFNREFFMMPGFQTIRFTMHEIQQTRSGRQLDLSQIERFSFFTTAMQTVAAESPVVFIGDMRLVR